ncbi:MAG: hypothetical protein LBS84_04300 [Clostridiales bacterium]|jgi:hypothetical protein|nr:hypothetical protein [Clostridiales bacterium]
MKGKIYSVLRISLFLSASLFGTTAYAASKGNVEQSDTQMIQGLIDAAIVGETCLIPEGTYTVSGLSVTRPITLDGGGKVTLRYFGGDAEDCGDKPRDTEYILAVWSGGVVIEGIKFVNAYSSASSGIIHFLGDNLEIRGNEFAIGENCAGIISQAAAKQCLIDGNVFTAGSGRRSYPMIQLGEKASGALIKNNVLEGDFPDMLTSDFISNFLTIESEGAVVADNEFSYTGLLNDEDLGGYEDAEEPIAREAFAELTENHIKEANPWKRSMGDKSNPNTNDGFSFVTLGIICAIHAAAVLAYLRVSGRLRSCRTGAYCHESGNKPQ